MGTWEGKLNYERLTYGKLLTETATKMAMSADERDRLAAENAELREEFDFRRNALCDSLRAANATLDKLREVVPKQLLPHSAIWLSGDEYDEVSAILYPEGE